MTISIKVWAHKTAQKVKRSDVLALGIFSYFLRLNFISLYSHFDDKSIKVYKKPEAWPPGASWKFPTCLRLHKAFCEICKMTNRLWKKCAKKYGTNWKFPTCMRLQKAFSHITVKYAKCKLGGEKLCQKKLAKKNLGQVENFPDGCDFKKPFLISPLNMQNVAWNASLSKMPSQCHKSTYNLRYQRWLETCILVLKTSQTLFANVYHVKLDEASQVIWMDLDAEIDFLAFTEKDVAALDWRIIWFGPCSIQEVDRNTLQNIRRNPEIVNSSKSEIHCPCNRFHLRSPSLVSTIQLSFAKFHCF